MRIYLSFAIASLFMASAVGAEKCGAMHGCAALPHQTTVSDHCKKAVKKNIAPPAAACDCAHYEKAAADISPRVDLQTHQPNHEAALPVFDTCSRAHHLTHPAPQAPPDRDEIYLQQRRLLI